MVKHDPWKTIINYKKHDKWTAEGRFILFRNKYGNLMIFIIELNTKDAGKYRIRVLDKWYMDLTLNVIKGKQFNNENPHFKCMELISLLCDS